MRIAFFTESLLPLVDGVSHTLGHLFAGLEEEDIEFRVYAPFAPRSQSECVKFILMKTKESASRKK
jgi:hypothetical protein